jgi:hypothetical protein
MLRLALALVAVTATVAVADPDTAAPAAPADPDYAAAMTAFDAGDYATAYAGLTKDYDHTKQYELLFDIARTEKRLAWYRAAIHTFSRYLKEGGDRVAQDRHDATIEEIVEIHKVAAEVTLEVEGGPAELTVDGHPEDPAPLDGPLLLSAGKHTVVATRGRARDEKHIEVKALEKTWLRLIPFALDTPGVLTVRTVPDGASLTVDDEPRGHAPWSGPLENGPHKVIASAVDYVASQRDVVMTNGDKQSLTLELHPVHVVKHWYKHWYVYAGAVVVVGAVVGTVLALQKNDDLIIYYH